MFPPADSRCHKLYQGFLTPVIGFKFNYRAAFIPSKPKNWGHDRLLAGHSPIPSLLSSLNHTLGRAA